MGLRLVPDLPIFANDEPEVPFDVLVSNSTTNLGLCFTKVESLSFEVTEESPYGKLTLKHSDGRTTERICESGDSVKSNGFVTVEAVEA
jgi:hypothetical protein